MPLSPPTIQVNGASHSRMIISPPRINLRRAASYNHADRGPLSSTSSRFGFEYLMFNSPPPSPGLPLPQQASRVRKSSKTPRPSRVFRVLLWASGAIFIIYLASQSIRQGQVVPVLGWASSDEEYEMVGQDDLPDFPTPIVVTDRRGRAKWTVSIPPSHDFPLKIREYSDMYAKCQEVSGRVNALHTYSHGIDQINLVGSQSPVSDRYFVDVMEAEKLGFLPNVVGKGHESYKGGILGMDKDSLIEKPICKSSLTYVLESDDAGLGKTLMALWMAYGLARREGRAFFIDDTRWAYGQYTALFEPPPIPDCHPPPRHQMLPCPLQAHHLVVSSVNTRDIFGSHLNDDFEEAPRNLESAAQRDLYQLARQGYEDLFLMNQEDREYVFNRAKEHRIKALAAEGHAHNGKIIGMHVRRGDRHPFEFQYGDSYIPLNAYSERAQKLLNATFAGRGPNGAADKISMDHSFYVLASDDPLVYDAEDFQGAIRAQEQIRLAGKTQIQQVNPNKNVMHKFVDETFGWEGGFFAAMFWNLGVSSLSAANGARWPEKRLPPSSETIRLRSLVGRAYLMDLAVLVDLSDAVICTVSAMGCRLMAVMMGFERAFEKGQWVNIDGDYRWTGAAW